MALGILSRKYRTQTRGAVDLDILQACIGEEIKVITELYFDQIYICYDVNDIIVDFVPNPGVSGRAYNEDLIYFSDGEFLNNCQVGDTFISNSTYNVGSFVLLEIINGGLGRFDRAFTSDTMVNPANYVANISALKSLVYQYAINASGEYISQTDGSLQKLTADSATALTDVTVTMHALGNKDWRILLDSVGLTGEGDDTNFPTDSHVRIKITHTVVVTPLYLAGQYEEMRLAIAPDYFKPDNLIKYFSQIDWNKNNTYLDPAKSIALDPVGQFGWFGTKYNGAASDYSISSLTIERVSDAESINQLEYNECEVKFTITSTGADFHATQTALIFGFNYLPEDSALYKNTDRFLDTNFCFDSKILTPNGVVRYGNNYGSATQVIKTIKGDILTASTVGITARILFGADQVDILTQEDVAKYAMWIICERTSLDIALCDKSNLLVQVNEIHVQLTSVDLLSDVTKFLEHPYEVVGQGEETLEMFPVDDVVVNSAYALDFTGLENDGILLKSCTPKIVLTHATEANVVLDSVRINLDNFPTVGTAPAVQSIDFNQQRPYKIENGIRKYVSFQRDFSEDTSTVKNFVLNFPFMNRWEYWIQLAGLTSIPESLFDSDVPFNGANPLWDRLANSTGWTLKYIVTFEILQNGELFEQEFEHVLTSTYFETNTEWNNCNIKTYDSDNNEIIVGSKKYAYATEDTKVVVSFEKTVGDVPDINHIAIVIWAEGYEGGGVSEVSRISSAYEVTDISAFKSVDTSNKVKLTKTLNVFTGEALLNFNKINNLSKLSLYARIYVLQDTLEVDRITNDFILRVTNDGQTRLILS